MKVFISWSGDRSKAIAQAFRDYLGLALPNCAPFMSEKDIEAGGRGQLVLARELEASSSGILVLTPENYKKPWILFEAGALSKHIEDGIVCPYLVDLNYSDVPPPLGQFQMKRATKEGTLELLDGLNNRLPSPHPRESVHEWFELFWPKIAVRLSEPVLDHTVPTSRPSRDILNELVHSVARLESLIMRSIPEDRLAGLSVDDRILPFVDYTELQKELRLRGVNLTLTLTWHCRGDRLMLTFLDESGSAYGVVGPVDEFVNSAKGAAYILENLVGDKGARFKP